MSAVSLMVRAVTVLGCLYVCSSVPSKKAAVTGKVPSSAARLIAAEPAAPAETCPPPRVR